MTTIPTHTLYFLLVAGLAAAHALRAWVVPGTLRAMGLAHPTSDQRLLVAALALGLTFVGILLTAGFCRLVLSILHP